MNIIYVIHQFLPYIFAGTEIYTYELTKEMSWRGNRVLIVSMPHRFDYKFPEYTYNSEQFDFVKIKNKRNHLKEFKDILRSYKPDIVHFQHLQYFSPRIVEVTKALNIPMILSLHDYFYICKRIRLLTRDDEICASSTNCPGCKDHRLAWKKYIDKVDLILANSHFTRNTYIKNGFSSEKIIVNYPGINTERVGKIRHSESDILRFGFLGTVIKAKGIEVLIDAFNKLDKPASLEIWGRVNSYKLDLLKKIKNPYIEIKGQYTPENIKDVLSGLDIVVIPSIWPEAWSIVKTEALITGLGVLASSIGSLPEGIKDNKAVLFKPNNVASLLRAVKSVMADKDFWKDKKSNKYNVKTIEEDARKIEYIYNQLVSKYTGYPITKLPKRKKYIVNTKIITWYYAENGIDIHKFSNQWILAYVLQDVGARFWELFTEFKSIDEIAHIIFAEYNTSKKELERDIKSFMNELQEEKIIVKR